MRVSTIAFLFFPFVIWVGVVSMIVIAVKSNFRTRGTPPNRQGSSMGTYQSRKTAQRPTRQRPQMEKGLFDMDINRTGRQKKKTVSGSSFGNTGFDTYTAKGRRKDFVSGYDKKLTGRAGRNSARVQYSHTYDGHEPWDKCLPKEKDPWDKDFYA